MAYPDPKDPSMTITDLENKLRDIEYEIRLAEEFRDSLPDLQELRLAYRERLAEATTEKQMAPAIEA